MASDHRGRALHAGRRTTQEMLKSADTYASQGGWNPGRYMASDTHKTYSKGPLFVSPANPHEGNDYYWSVNRISDGRNTESFMDPDNKPTVVDPNTNYRMINTLGRTKTPMRAMIAAEAMKKRIDEGRDLKTGKARQ